MGTFKPKLVSIPDLYDWTPGINEVFFQFDGEVVLANYDKDVGDVSSISTFPTFFIKKTHYKKRMENIVHHINYFTRFYDLDRETFFSYMSMKYEIDTNLKLMQKEFVNQVMDRIVTPNFISKCKMMSYDLYKLNIDSDSTGKYNNTPKITNAQAFQIVAVSFCFKILTPLILHYSNTNLNFDPAKKTEYIIWFTALFNRVIKKFEHGDTPFYNSLCRFVVFRGEKTYRNNMQAFYQKKMLRGDTLETYNEMLLREVVCVKALYKLDHTRPCVAYIDGIIHRYSTNYLRENFSSKPYEIDSEESSKDSDESLSHAEAIEMATYKRDESSAMISDINNDCIMQQLREWYAFNISDEEYKFYYDNFYPSEISRFIFDNFYAKKFRDPYAIANLNKQDTIYLLICLKKVLQRYKMFHLAQLLTARVFGKFKKNIVKSAKFLDRITTSPVYSEIISKKYNDLMELEMKENPILRPLSLIINSTYELVDFDEELNGYQLEHLDPDAVSNDYLLFLSII